ncbi:helix-turn-helix transcriptional regulator [Roseburia hominis]|jgi:predicted DNA-binding transcriptional regulator YafY|uniref:helix-turn-helix transcriptional regulator n=1 Tax=Roseburia hominis TaxID=301301 RepID=UPI0022E20764|nr:WYL domain-containing protein [Roseburia hominis]
MGRGRSEKQKQKLLYMAQLLYERTDEDHPVTTQEVIDYLEADGIRSERKTVYTDMEELEDFGLDIIRVKERPGGYYLASRKFELAELKLLVDAVQASKFITTKKSRELIAKLETLCGREQAKQLHRQVVVTNRSKAVNENIYYNVDMIYNAIAENVKIRFQYFEWTVNKEMKLRRDGSYYEVSPWLLSWDDENYYLIAYDDRSRDIRHYRVDKMLKIELTAESREGKEQFGNFDVAAYSRKTFGMFAGEDETVTLICEDALTGVMIDRFGKEVAMRRYDETRIRVRVSVAVSRQFFGWLAGLGAAVRIESPESVVREYHEYLETILKTYGEQEL